MSFRKRTIIVGDIHGCLDEFKLLMDKCQYEKERDRLILLGDLVDRGPDSNGTITYARRIQAEGVLGNHDEKYVRFQKHETKKLESLKRGDKKPYKNPMRLGQRKLDIFNSLDKENIEWLSYLPNKLFIPEFELLCVHAGVLPDKDPLEQEGSVLRHCRYVDDKTLKPVKLGKDHKCPVGSSFWGKYYVGKINIIHGHHVGHTDEPIIWNNDFGYQVIGIDTGCCFGGALTAYILNEEGNFHFEKVKALEEYYSFDD